MAWCAAAAGLVVFFTVAPLQVLTAIYAAGILAVTSRRSPVTPATLAISGGFGVAGGLLVVALWNPTRTPRAPGLPLKTDVPLLFMVLIAVIAAGTLVTGAAAARRASGKSDPVALRARSWQFLAAGPLTAAAASLMLPLLRVSDAVHFARRVPGEKGFPQHRSTGDMGVFLVAGPLVGLAMGIWASSITAAQPPGPATA